MEITEQKFAARVARINNLAFISTKKAGGWSPLFDKLFGDFIIFFPGYDEHPLLRIDVKGGSISKESIIWFKGDYFVIYESSNESAAKGLVFKPQILRDLISSWPDKYFDRLPFSGDPGIHYSRLVQIKEMGQSIDVFFKNILKE